MYDFFSIAQKIAIDYHIILDASLQQKIFFGQYVKIHGNFAY